MADADDVPGPAEAARALLDVAGQVADGEVDAVERVAARLGSVAAAGGRVYAFGAGHAQAFAMELCARAGGLGMFLAMNLDDLRPERRDAWLQLADSAPERDPGNGVAILDHHQVTRTDAVLLASNSGRNGALVEAALECRRRGIYTAAVTSLSHARSVDSRHPSGQHLHDVVDDVIDNHCPYGDAMLDVPQVGRVIAASTVAFAMVAQMLNAALIRGFVRRGAPPQVFRSANVG